MSIQSIIGLTQELKSSNKSHIHVHTMWHIYLKRPNCSKKFEQVWATKLAISSEHFHPVKEIKTLMTGNLWQTQTRQSASIHFTAYQKFPVLGRCIGRLAEDHLYSEHLVYQSKNA